MNKQKHQIDKKVLRQDKDFSTRLIFANKEIREKFIKMVNTKYNSTEDMINKLQELKRTTKLKFYKNISNYYNNMNVRSDEDPFDRNTQGISGIYHEVFLLMKFLETKPQVKKMNISYYDLYYIVTKNRIEKEVVDDNEYENDYINFDDFITTNHKPREVILR